MNGHRRGTGNQWALTKGRLPHLSARLSIEEEFVNRTAPGAEQCAKFTMVHARLFRAMLMGVNVPNLVEYLVLTLSDGPLDRKTTQATHEFWLKTAKPRPAVEKGK